ncbi:PREDICTED: uncharacterized protein LOC106750235 [Dinoponera quadriceps]|uniref:Uncharacterized protein LOC106750235 n=1 Tax=Dinoponera quadriceps TaxID=609295 RepID=A0A6P3Y6G3_DINQU|nr:PREDICTED: uncharacterized protein LOC106750235 [Dinoponera quadriceps]
MNCTIDYISILNCYTWIIKNKNYNKFFNPNVCHVCKRRNNGILISCKQCQMIYYCSTTHKSMHFRHHQKFCNYVSAIILEKQGTEWKSVRSSTLRWTESRNELLHVIQKRYPCDLQPYETQMITFAKSCRICHRQDLLYACEICYSDNYCETDMNEFHRLHKETCEKLRLCLSLELTRDMFTFHFVFSDFPEKGKPIDEMTKFIVRYIHNLRTSNEIWLDTDYFYSDYASGPLTLYYGMKNANLLDILKHKKTCVIHVLGSYIEGEYTRAWELLLHLLHKIKELTIHVIAPDLKAESGNVVLCSELFLSKYWSTLHREHVTHDCSILYWL